VVLCDLDGVVGQFVPAFLRTYRLSGGSIPPDFVVDDWGFPDRLPDQGAVAAAWRDPRIFLEQDLYPGAAEALKLLNDNSDLMLVTSAAHPLGSHVPAKLRWLAVVAEFIKPEQILFTCRKELVFGDIFIDDYHCNVVRWRARHPEGRAFLVAREWNRSGWSLVESGYGFVFDGELIGLARMLTERRTR
jgi:5'(3')-deoxyribonucleotidase